MAVWDWIYDNLLHPDLGIKTRKKPMAGVTLRQQPGLGMSWRAGAQPRVRHTKGTARDQLKGGFTYKNPYNRSGASADYYDRMGRRPPRMPQPGPDPLGELYNSLIGQLQGNVGVDEDDLMRQIRAAYDPVFDARRAAVEEMMRSAESRSATGRQEVTNQYAALGKDYERLAPEAAEQAEGFREGTEELYGKLRSNIEGNYSRIQKEQKDLFSQLGIEAAAPEVLEPQGKAAAEAMTAADQFGTLAQQREREAGQIDERYWREGAPLARMTGANISSEMLADLENYLRQRETDITGIEAERTAGIQGSYNQLLAQSRAQAQEQQRWQADMLYRILSDQMRARQEASQMPEIKNPMQFAGVLGPQGQPFLDAYNQLMQQPEMITGKQYINEQFPDYPVPNTAVPITDAFREHKIQQLLNAGAIDPMTAELLLQYFRMTS